MDGRLNCAKAITLGNVYLGLMDALLTVDGLTAGNVSAEVIRRACLLFNTLETLRGQTKSVLSFHFGGQCAYSYSYRPFLLLTSCSHSRPIYYDSSTQGPRRGTRRHLG